jgi:hypothetical protein
MDAGRVREPVRLGSHGGQSIFEQAKGLHDDAAGLVVIPGGPADDPLVMFQEHGMNEICRYFDLRPNALLPLGTQPDENSPGLRSLVGDDDIRRNWFALRHIFTQEDPKFANTIISSLRAEMGSGSLGPLIGVSPRFQRRWAAIRMLASIQSQPNRALPDFVGAAHALDFHGNAIYRAYIYEPLVLLGSPFTRGFVTGRGIVGGETVLFVLMAGVGECQVIKDEEITWSTLYEADLPSLRGLDGDDRQWMGQTNRAVHDIDARTLLTWWTRSVNELFTEATDLGRYRHDDGLLNAGRAHRELLTLERLIANCIRIQTRPTDHLARVVLAYEFFDLLPNLVSGRFDPPHVWGQLGNPSVAKRTLDRAFASSPEPIKTYLRKRTNAVLKKLKDETVEHVVGTLASKKKVDVNGTPYAQDTYIAQLLHQFRNTHHGYELDDPRKTALLASHDGHVSAAFPELVVLYTVALITDSKRALDGGWL